MEWMEIGYSIEKMISLNPVVLFTTLHSSECEDARRILLAAGIPFLSYEMDLMPKGEMIRKHVELITHGKRVPQVFINGKCIGSATDLKKMYLSGDLFRALLGNHVDKVQSNCKCEDPIIATYDIPPCAQPKYFDQKDKL